jgi:hypothetical protein
MSVSPGYLEATVFMPTVARALAVDALVNMSQMTVSRSQDMEGTPGNSRRR